MNSLYEAIILVVMSHSSASGLAFGAADGLAIPSRCYYFWSVACAGIDLQQVSIAT